MKEIIQYYAKYNAKVNDDMIKVIADNIKDPMNLKLNGYFFKTLGDLLEHIYIADMNWMDSFLAVDDYGISIGKEIGEIPGYDERIFVDFDNYRKARDKLDQVIVEYAEKIKEEDFNKMAIKYNRKGEQLEKILWKCLVHFFNHETHHRGQVSNILDDMEIENNYSNMVFIE